MMENTSKNYKKQNSATTGLQFAIANLEQFAKKNESSSILHVADLTVSEGMVVEDESLKKTTSFARCFLGALFSSKLRTQYRQKKMAVQAAVQHAVDFIKRNHLLLQRLKTGSPEEQKLASSTWVAIHRFNSVLDQSQKLPSAWNERLSQFFSKYAGLAVDEDLLNNRIDLPASKPFEAVKAGNLDLRQKMNLAFEQHLKPFASKQEQYGFTAVKLNPVVASPLSKQEVDLLRMKTHTLLGQEGVKFKLAEMFQEIKDAPIETVIDPEKETVNLNLKMTLLPGIIADVKGAFQRRVQVFPPSTPIPGSFQLSMHSTQMGFPFPTQYVGWALSEVLIPHYPHRLDQLPLFKPLYLLKQESIAKLHPGGAWFENARNLWKIKKRVFSQEMIQLHGKLILSLLHAAEPFTLSNTQTVQAFFDAVKKHSTPLLYLSATYQAINDYAMNRTYALMQEIWTQHYESDTQSIFQEIQEALSVENASTLKILEKEIESSSNEEKAALDFIQMMYKLLHRPVEALLVQQFSETLGIKPPLLNEFERKLQALALVQLSAFLEELEHSEQYLVEPQLIQEHMQKLLTRDIALLENDLEGPVESLVDELEQYFNSRHQHKTIKGAAGMWKDRNDIPNIRTLRKEFDRDQKL